MLKECLEVFKKQMQVYANPDDIILHGYIPADGTYLFVKADGSFKSMGVKFNKKIKQLEEIPREYDKLKFYDYHARLVSMDKPQDPKKIIHSNNYFALWVKKESFQNGKFNKEAIDRYFDNLKNPLEKYKKSQDIALYKKVETEIGSIDEEQLEKNRNWIHENVFNLEEKGISLQEKDYLKIFFETDKETYIAEEKRYLYVKLFNNNDYNLEINGKILGLPGDNLGYNQKKPFLEQHARKITVSNLIDIEEAILQKKFFEYLMNNATVGNNQVYIDLESQEIRAVSKGKLPKGDFTGLFLLIQKGKEVEIIHQDSIVAYKSTLTPRFYYANVLGLEEDEVIYKYYNQKSDMQGLINDIFFSKYLVLNYFSEPEKLSVTDMDIKRSILKTRDIIFAWLYKGKEISVVKGLWKVGMDLSKASIKKGNLKKAGKQFNFAVSLSAYEQGGESMADAYVEISRRLKEKLNTKDEDAQIIIEEDKEFLFAVGQLVRYLISKSKTKDKRHSLANPFFNMKEEKQLKKKLHQMFLKYNHAIFLDSKRFNRLYSMVTRYEIEEKIDGTDIIAGYLSDNLIYSKEKEDEING